MALSDLSPGDSFGDYTLIRQLGKGGFAEVWEGERRTDGRRVALKVLAEMRRTSVRTVKRFEREGQLAATLSSPRCVYVFGAGVVGDLPYIAMELMPGGTLADRITDHPLPPTDAVDYVLDVLDGLESAQIVGILHRDVKPSNVFLDASGRAKIGDFGISKSLDVDSDLTQTGAFLGTPAYASPEQFAAEPLDLRSDLYSVGVMLYELVTGALPYTGSNPAQVLTQVLTRGPAPFSQHQVAVPAGLQRAILRLLANSREKRYQSYEAARAALRPFSSRGLAAAALDRRFGAIAIDVGLLYVVDEALISAGLHISGSLATVLVSALFVAYFTLTEGLWSASLGKRLMGLRVTTVSGAPPTVARVALRALVFWALYDGLQLAINLAMGKTLGSAAPLSQLLQQLAQFAGIVPLVSTVRRANGYAGLHEIASGTRTAALVARERADPVPRSTLPLETGPGSPAGYGPYAVTGTVWRRDGRALVVAHDAELRRDVWITVYRNALGAPPLERLRNRGAGSLTWLQRGEDRGVTWDAYGAPPGTAFTFWATQRDGLSWREMRDVLNSLARELVERLARDGTAGVASPDHVWLAPSGRALLLDFPVRGSAAGEVEITPTTWRVFLARVAALGFGGSAGAVLPPHVPLPESARALTAELADGTRRSIGDFVAALDAAAMRPAEVTRRRRAAPFAILALLPAFMLLTQFVVIPLAIATQPPWHRALSVNLASYQNALARADSRAATDSNARHTAEAIREMLADAQLKARRSPRLWSHFSRTFDSRTRAALDSDLARYPAPDSASVAAARTWVATHVTLRRWRSGLEVLANIVTVSSDALARFGVISIVLAVLLQGGLLFAVFGMVVVTADGARAGRLRCGLRAAVAWFPLLGLLLAETIAATMWERVVLVAIAVAGTAYAVWQPARGLAERLTGTVLVPK